MSGRRPAAGGFTLVEITVSVALLAAIMVLVTVTIQQVQRVWTRTAEKASQFQAARAGFEAMTRRLAQATLNTYWRAHDGKLGGNRANFRFRRQSDLQFISAPTARLFAGNPPLPHMPRDVATHFPGHAVFFHAPLGHTEEEVKADSTMRFRALGSTLAGCGYFVEYGPDTGRPPFLQADPAVPLRHRFRLQELLVPAERLTVFQRPDDADYSRDPRVYSADYRAAEKKYYVGLMDEHRRTNANWVRPYWMTEALRRRTIGEQMREAEFSYARTLAENIIALILLPKLPEKDRHHQGSPDPTRLALAPRYEFDSWRILDGGPMKDPADPDILLDNTARENLLPPIVQVTMVAVDEISMQRAGVDAANIPSWTNGLFRRVEVVDDYEADLRALEEALRADVNRPNYRVFTTDLVIRGSKWSEDPQ